jgi:hypothetical protein
MTGEEAFAVWAPEESIWSPWAKPVLFAADGEVAAAVAPPATAVDVSWSPAATRRTALVIELPGAVAVAAALALAERGYRPVPLFNSSFGPQAVVPVGPLRALRAALLDGCARLASARLPPEAPPAFLLDSDRKGVEPPAPEKFDNRWVVFAQDFPSASFFRRQGVESVLLVTPRGAVVALDLEHVLYRWREGGLGLLRQDVEGGAAVTLDVRRPRGFRSAWYRLLVTLRLRRNSAGGFGSVVPAPGGGGRSMAYG